MRMLDWITVCFAMSVVIGLASGVVLTWFGVWTILGNEESNPLVCFVAAFPFSAAIGCFLAAGYCAWLLYSKQRDWRQWLRFKPPRSYWDVAEEAEEKRKGR